MIKTKTQKLIDGSVAESSKKVYRSALHRFETKLGDWRKCSDRDIAEYFADMHEGGLSPATINMAASAIRFAARLDNVESPIGALCKSTLAGIARAGSIGGHGQAKPVGWHDCERIIKFTANDGVDGLRDATIFAVASDALLRRSEICAINFDDIVFEGKSALLTIRRSKSDQFGEGEVMYLGPSTTKYLKRWLNKANITTGAVFRPVYQKKVIARRLSDRQVARIIKKRCSENNIEGARGHSLRVGGAVSLASAGATLVDMQKAGRWKSPTMPGRYAAGEEAKRGPIARFRYGGDK